MLTWTRTLDPNRLEPVTPMWTMLERALRRLRNRPWADPVHGAATKPETNVVDDLVLALGPREFERLGRALGEANGSKVRADTPDLLVSALTAAITQSDGCGIPHVWRSPAGLHTTESWQIRIDGADTVTRLAIGRAIRGGAFA